MLATRRQHRATCTPLHAYALRCCSSCIKAECRHAENRCAEHHAGRLIARYAVRTRLAIQLLRLEESLLAAIEEYQPSAITGYLWDLAKAYGDSSTVNCRMLRGEIGRGHEREPAVAVRSDWPRRCRCACSCSGSRRWSGCRKLSLFPISQACELFLQIPCGRKNAAVFLFCSTCNNP